MTRKPVRERRSTPEFLKIIYDDGSDDFDNTSEAGSDFFVDKDNNKRFIQDEPDVFYEELYPMFTEESESFNGYSEIAQSYEFKKKKSHLEKSSPGFMDENSDKFGDNKGSDSKFKREHYQDFKDLSFPGNKAMSSQEYKDTSSQGYQDISSQKYKDISSPGYQDTSSQEYKQKNNEASFHDHTTERSKEYLNSEKMDEIAEDTLNYALNTNPPTYAATNDVYSTYTPPTTQTYAFNSSYATQTHSSPTNSPSTYAPPTYAPSTYTPSTYHPSTSAPSTYAPPTYASPKYAPPTYDPPTNAPPTYASPKYATPTKAPPTYDSPTYASPTNAPQPYAPQTYAPPPYASPTNAPQAYPPSTYAPPTKAPPTYSPSTYSPSTYSPPTYDPPTKAPPTYDPPTYAPPTYASPTYAPPTKAPPTYDSQTYDAPPTYAPPTYASPTFAPPTKAPPTYAPPTYDPPTKASPTYAPPTYAPQTKASPTKAPQTNAPPTNVPTTYAPSMHASPSYTVPIYSTYDNPLYPTLASNDPKTEILRYAQTTPPTYISNTNPSTYSTDIIPSVKSHYKASNKLKNPVKNLASWLYMKQEITEARNQNKVNFQVPETNVQYARVKDQSFGENTQYTGLKERYTEKVNTQNLRYDPGNIQPKKIDSIQWTLEDGMGWSGSPEESSRTSLSSGWSKQYGSGPLLDWADQDGRGQVSDWSEEDGRGQVSDWSKQDRKGQVSGWSEKDDSGQVSGWSEQDGRGSWEKIRETSPVFMYTEPIVQGSSRYVTSTFIPKETKLTTKNRFWIGV